MNRREMLKTAAAAGGMAMAMGGPLLLAVEAAEPVEVVPPAPRPDLARDRVMVIMGGVMPMQSIDPTRVRARDVPKHMERTDKPVCWMEADRAESAPTPASQYPSMFACAHQVQVGTIDGLVKTFRAQLVAAVKSQLFNGDLDAETDPTMANAWRIHADLQQRVTALIGQGKLNPCEWAWTAPFVDSQNNQPKET